MQVGKSLPSQRHILPTVSGLAHLPGHRSVARDSTALKAALLQNRQELETRWPRCAIDPWHGVTYIGRVSLKKNTVERREGMGKPDFSGQAC